MSFWQNIFGKKEQKSEKSSNNQSVENKNLQNAVVTNSNLGIIEYHIHGQIFPVPRNLGLLIVEDSQIVGRDDDYQKVAEQLTNGDKTLISTGVGGVGKTKLAMYVGSKLLVSGHYQHVAVLQIDTSQSSQNIDSFQSKVVNVFRYQLISSLKDSGKILPTNEKEAYYELLTILKNLKIPKLLILDDVTKDWLKENTNQIKTDFGDWDILATNRDGGEDIEYFKNINLDNLTKEGAYRTHLKSIP